MMGFLSPLFLAAAALVAVPVVLHLFHRHRARRVAFPALRYLQRTERDHARRIRLRQLLLLVLRSAVILLLAAAGARLFVRGRGAAHEPTALAVVLDNSLSSGRVVGERRVLDTLAALARRSVAAAGPDDRIWVLRAGEPWDVATPGDRTAALRRIDDTRVSAAAADLPRVLARARGLVTAAGLPGAEVHLLSDLQATAFPATAAADDPTDGGAARVPVLVWWPGTDGSPPANHWVSRVQVGAGLPPLADRRTEIAVTVEATGADTAALPVRLVIDERVRAAGTVGPGGTLLLPAGPFARGTVQGWVETDPDALRDDDRRWFAFTVRPPVPVAVEGSAGSFLGQALDVLEEEGRARRVDAAGARVVFSGAGAGAFRHGGDGVAFVVLPPSDPTLLPALNRRLAEGSVPWRYKPPADRGEVSVTGSRGPGELEGTVVRRHYRLVPAGDVPEGGIPAGLPGGEPFLVEGTRDDGSYLLLAAPLDPDWTDLPVSAAMVPLLEWILARAGGSASAPVTAGEAISTPAGATAVEAPTGTRFPVDGTQSFARTRDAGIYAVLRGDSVVERVAVVPPPAESRLAPVERDVLEAAVGEGWTRVSSADAWSRAAFVRRQGPELWRPLLALVLLLLLAEAWAAGAPTGVRAGAGQTSSGPSPGRRSPPSTESRTPESSRAGHGTAPGPGAGTRTS